MTSGTYSNAFAKLGRWALGQRAVHDLVIHPLMALTNYSNWSVKLHDYHAFTTLTETGGGLVGITGATADVEKVFERLGIDPEHCHTDGLLCYGLGDTGSREKMECPSCQGRGEWWEHRGGRGGVYTVRVTCPECYGKGRVKRK